MDSWGGSIPTQFHTLYTGHPVAVWIAVGVLVTQAILIGTLLSTIRRNRVTQQLLLESEARFRLLFENSRHAMAVSTKDRFSVVNSAWAELYGYDSPEQLIGSSIFDLVPEPIRGVVAEKRNQRLLNPQESTIYEAQGLRKDGTIFHAEIFGSFFDWDGQLQNLAIVRDITSEKLAEDALRETQRQRDVALTAAQMGTWYWNPVQRRSFWSETQHRLFGLQPGMFDGAYASFLSMVDSRDRDRVEQAFQQSVSTGSHYQVQYRVHLPDGSQRWLSAQGHPNIDHEGTLLEVTGVTWDITEQKVAEEALRRNEEELCLIIDNLPALIAYVDQEGRYLRNNAAYQEWYGRDPAALQGKKVEELFSPDVYQKMEPRLKLALQGHRVAYTTMVPKLGAGMRDVDAIYTPDIAEDGTVRGIVVLGVDVTERLLAEKALLAQAEELARSNADLQQFAYVSSHDLQEPLRMVVAYSQMLAKNYGPDLDEAANDYLNYLTDAGRRMTNLVSDLLTYSRVTNPEAVPMTEVDLNEVTNWAVSNLQMAIGSNSAVLHMDELPKVQGNSVQLVQVYQNLIGNALKYARDAAPVIYVRAQDLGSEWELSVEDNGQGIPPEYREKVFGLFKRLHGRSVPGTGIGLAVAHKIVQRHGGKIWVEAAEPHGSIFKFTLPK